MQIPKSQLLEMLNSNVKEQKRNFPPNCKGVEPTRSSGWDFQFVAIWNFEYMVTLESMNKKILSTADSQ